jgi:hypothetical protein
LNNINKNKIKNKQNNDIFKDVKLKIETNIKEENQCIDVQKNYRSNIQLIKDAKLIKRNDILTNEDWGLGIGPNPQSPIPNIYFIMIIILSN